MDTMISVLYPTNTYNKSLLFGASDTITSQIQKVQSAASKMIFRKRKYDNLTPLLHDLHWLPVQQRILFKILLLTYRALNNEGPTSDITDYFFE